MTCETLFCKFFHQKIKAGIKKNYGECLAYEGNKGSKCRCFVKYDVLPDAALKFCNWVGRDFYGAL